MTTPAAKARGYTIALTDHRGRVYDTEFYVDLDGDAPGWFVWGIAKSGKRQIVSRPARNRVRQRSGRRVYTGWNREEKANAILTIFLEQFWNPRRQRKPDAQVGACTDAVCGCTFEDIEPDYIPDWRN